MRCFIEVTNRKGKKVPLASHNQTLEFPNTEAAKQYIRNHALQYADGKSGCPEIKPLDKPA